MICGVKMDNHQKKIISSFEDKLRHLFTLYRKLEKDNQELHQLYEEGKREKKRLEKELDELSNKYNHLKTALIINPNRQDVADTRRRISKLVREVDTCIKLLNDIE